MVPNNMAIAATFVVAIYLIGVAMSPSPQWWEWAGALVGAAAAVWFWVGEFKRARRGR